MARPSRFEVIYKKILIITDYLKKQPKILFSSSDLRKIFSKKRKEWGIPKKTTFYEFLESLILKNIIISVNIPMHNQIKYALFSSSEYKIALEIKKDAYFCHRTAMYIHNLIPNEPEPINIYINSEQRKKPNNKDTLLIQENINKAFSQHMRETKQIVKVKNSNIYVLSGKKLNRLGVEIANFKSEKVPVTGLERTLIDITVRPNYAGGVNEILKAYLMAKDKIDVPKLVSMLNKMKYIYPYHQAIGFYMENAGYKDCDLNLLREINIIYDFYLTYAMTEKSYSKKWKIFYPKDFCSLEAE